MSTEGLITSRLTSFADAAAVSTRSLHRFASFLHLILEEALEDVANQRGGGGFDPGGFLGLHLDVATVQFTGGPATPQRDAGQ